MDVDGGNDHDHRFGTGAHPDPHPDKPVGLGSLGDESHHAAEQAHGLIENLGDNVTHLAENLSHLPPGDHPVDLHAAPEHDFGTHHDGADGLHGLHDSIHHETSHLSFSGEEHHGLGDVAHDPAHDDPQDHHHHPDTFGLGLH
jgi:hypothetical protein